MHHLPSEEVCTLLRRSEAEHLVGQELIKSLANFKQMGSGSFILNQKNQKQVSDASLQGGLRYANEEVSLYQEGQTIECFIRSG
jgi:hypothetical protein